MQRMLCPRITENMSMIGLKIPDSIIDKIDTIGRATMTTRSAVVRELVLHALRDRGHVASAGEMAAAR